MSKALDTLQVVQRPQSTFQDSARLPRINYLVSVISVWGGRDTCITHHHGSANDAAPSALAGNTGSVGGSFLRPERSEDALR